VVNRGTGGAEWKMREGQDGKKGGFYWSAACGNEKKSVLFEASKTSYWAREGEGRVAPAERFVRGKLAPRRKKRVSRTTYLSRETKRTREYEEEKKKKKEGIIGLKHPGNLNESQAWVLRIGGRV